MALSAIEGGMNKGETVKAISRSVTVNCLFLANIVKSPSIVPTKNKKGLHPQIAQPFLFSIETNGIKGYTIK